ncbi:MAG: chemotaxis protein CheW [Acidobacteriota bacterium]
MTRKPRTSQGDTTRPSRERRSPQKKPADTEADRAAEKQAAAEEQAAAEAAAELGSESLDELIIPADEPPDTAAESAAESEPAEDSAAGNAEAPAPKIELPAFGFAADLLKKPEDEATPEAPEDEAPSIDKADPERIFAFADSLERNAAELEPQQAPVRLETWVAFQLAGETFALPVEPVREVVRVASITRVPHAPSPIRGVTNMRGRVIPVIDLRLRIELPSSDLDRASRVIVVSSRGRLLGLLVDAVDQVIHIDLGRVQAPPDDVMTAQSDYISGVYHLEDQLILLLDIDRALVVQEAPVAESGASRSQDPLDLSAEEAAAGLS